MPSVGDSFVAWRWLLLVAVMAAGILGCRQTYPPDPAHDVDVASDGLTLKASYYSPGKPGPRDDADL